MALCRQHSEESFHLGRAHLTRMPHDPAPTLSANEKAHPIHISLLCAEAIVHVTDALAKLTEQANRVKNRHTGFHGSFIPVFLRSLSVRNPVCKPLRRARSGQNIPQGPVYFAEIAEYITLSLQEKLMALKTIVPFNYQAFVGLLGGEIKNLRLFLEEENRHGGWKAVLNRYQFSEMGRTEGEAIRTHFHKAIREAQDYRARVAVMNEIAAWGGMNEIEEPLAQAINATLLKLENEKNLTIQDIQGKRIATLSKIYEMWNPTHWIIYDSYSAKGLQWLIYTYWQNKKKEIFPEYLRFPFPPGRTHATFEGFPILGTPRQAALGFVYSSWLSRELASQLKNQDRDIDWKAYHVEMALFQLGHEI